MCARHGQRNWAGMDDEGVARQLLCRAWCAGTGCQCSQLQPWSYLHCHTTDPAPTRLPLPLRATGADTHPDGTGDCAFVPLLPQRKGDCHTHDDAEEVAAAAGNSSTMLNSMQVSYCVCVSKICCSLVPNGRRDTLRSRHLSLAKPPWRQHEVWGWKGRLGEVFGGRCTMPEYSMPYGNS